MAIESDDRIVVETPAARRRRLTFLGIIVTGVSAVAVIDRSAGTSAWSIGLLGLCSFGPITFLLLLRAIRNRPVLTLDADGFTDRSTLVSPGFVPWREVSGSRPAGGPEAGLRDGHGHRPGGLPRPPVGLASAPAPDKRAHGRRRHPHPGQCAVHEARGAGEDDATAATPTLHP